MLVSPLLLNAKESMLMTEFGMLMLVKRERLLNADFPMHSTVLGMIVVLQPTTSVLVSFLIIALLPSGEL